jgi:GNAT superfamily N-acetyltransferase
MIIASTSEKLPALREEASALLNEFDAADGLASYYALHHDARRTALFIHRGAAGMADGFLARCQTGFDLFRPLVTLRVRGTDNTVQPLLEAGMIAGRPYLLVIPAGLLPRVQPHVTLDDPVTNRVMRLDPVRFEPSINAMVVSGEDMDGNPRAEVRSGDRPVAVAGVNWRSPIFAEVYVRVEPPARGRGWGRAVVRSVVTDLLKQRVTPLYNVADDNDASYDLALDVGFVDVGAREVMAQAMLREELPDDDGPD